MILALYLAIAPNFNFVLNNLERSVTLNKYIYIASLNLLVEDFFSESTLFVLNSLSVIPLSRYLQALTRILLYVLQMMVACSVAKEVHEDLYNAKIR